MTRAYVMEAAETLLARRGFSDARLEDITEVAGLTRAALFYYFASKYALNYVVIEEVFGGLATRLANGG